jgi:hypothetical protein
MSSAVPQAKARVIKWQSGELSGQRKNMALTIIQFDVIFLPRVLNIQKSFPEHAADDN